MFAGALFAVSHVHKSLTSVHPNLFSLSNQYETISVLELVT
jgi:hypothetical protein